MSCLVIERSSHTCQCRIVLCKPVSPFLHLDSRVLVPWGEMQYIQERCEGVTGNFSNLRFVDQGVVEQVRGVLLFCFFFVLLFLRAIILIPGLLLFHHGSWDIEAHLNKLIPAGGSFATTILRSPALVTVDTIRFRLSYEIELDRNLVLSRQICI